MSAFNAKLRDIPVVFSPYCVTTPVYIGGVIYARSQEDIERWIDAGFLRACGIEP